MTDPSQRDVTGIVLAGGASKRMGRDKSLLSVGGRTLIQRTVDVLSSLFDEILVVADREDRFENLPRVRVVGDVVRDIGPLGGIYTGLMRASNSSGFVVACDMPLLDPEVIAGQLELWCTLEAEALVPVLDGRPEPLHSIYAKRCLPAIRSQIERGDYRVRAIFDAVEVRFWQPEPGEARAFTNVNTPDNWAELLGDGGGTETC